MSIANKIKEFRKKRGWMQKELADKIGVQAEAVSFWETERRFPRPKQIKNLCAAFGITEAELFGAAALKEPAAEYGPWQKIPLISWDLADRFAEQSANTAQEHLLIAIKEKNIFALKVTDNSMGPEFTEEDIIIVKPDTDIISGDYVIAADKQSGKAVFRQYKQYGDTVVLHPLNPKHTDIDATGSHRYPIIGKIIGKFKKY